ncbi:hypothetical protein A8924_7400 [Saccharopolyspora erythraea NRRL 2338]|uniref:Uncharacterized protein n=3 Tax=Saccharopolyspora erythraea TaxID=1836 RepID=A4FQ46_SACEN|nr:hypothetical protein [Saccharopolyspora erythraea]EQD84398.1 hypothetical protein N599_20320 [Saccharopolyspora erythraea D]PFG99816.1 hypothetical protein A8924_7371 [Saccharopolyspora erythraea NRRL 2338]PFG99843.1 hypothetical protein A8924_7400 [Saccharopolyspora erythraea NRRL 2338]QRK89687.1 hypothetical protein JQX30_35090 [Saccharopolyspora erythraea]CAM06171.1 hypothetical protein SACE_7010 [Saccharopolyspora erythraea NRRL 2338]
MAKSPIPMMKTGGGLLPKFVGALLTLAFLAMVIKQPAAAAEMLTGAGAALGAAVEGLMSFLLQLGK